jgi:transcriptional regulator with XRE-family HTH domain
MYADAVELIKTKAKELGLDQVKLARRSNISTSQVSRIFSLKSTASQENLANLAIAVNLPPEHILRVAGTLPTKPDSDPLTEEGLYVLQQLEGREKEDAIRFLRLRLQVQEERSRYSAKGKERIAESG